MRLSDEQKQQWHPPLAPDPRWLAAWSRLVTTRQQLRMHTNLSRGACRDQRNGITELFMVLTQAQHDRGCAGWPASPGHNNLHRCNLMRRKSPQQVCAAEWPSCLAHQGPPQGLSCPSRAQPSAAEPLPALSWCSKVVCWPRHQPHLVVIDLVQLLHSHEPGLQTNSHMQSK